MSLGIRFFSLGALFCIVIALAILPAQSSFAQQPTTSKDWSFGYQALNLLLQESDIEICSQREWLNSPSDEKFAIIIDAHARVDWSPATGRVPTLVMTADGQNLGTRFRPTLGEVAANQPQDFYSSRDCPIVRPNSTHEVFLGVQSLVCNTPGYIFRGPRRQPLLDTQFYPAVSTNPRRGFGRNNLSEQRRFSVIAADPVRRIWVADSLMFNNQMMFKGDNLRFADNAIRWLSDDYKRKKVLLVINNQQQDAVDPDDLEILTPIPTREEVVDALSKLPKGEIVKFANSVVRASEDENIFNDMIHKLTDDLKEGQVLRLIIFAIFTGCVFSAVVTFFWQRKVRRRTASVTTGRRQQNLSKRDGRSGASERQAAASLLLNAFCLDVADRRLADWPEFPTPIVSQGGGKNSSAVKATNEMADAYWKLRTKPKSYWTKQSLVDLELATNTWRQLIAVNDITIESDPN